jgi:hypothetical protein
MNAPIATSRAITVYHLRATLGALKSIWEKFDGSAVQAQVPLLIGKLCCPMLEAAQKLMT